MIFKSYLSKYIDLIKYRRSNPINSQFKEEHHILPKSLGGSNKKQNLINLSIKEHIFAHWYLMKHFEEIQDNTRYYKMYCALFRMIQYSKNMQFKKLCNNNMLDENILEMTNVLKIRKHIPKDAHKEFCKNGTINLIKDEETAKIEIYKFYLPIYESYKKIGMKETRKKYANIVPGLHKGILKTWIPEFEQINVSQKDKILIKEMFEYAKNNGVNATIRKYKEFKFKHLNKHYLWKIFSRHIENFIEERKKFPKEKPNFSPNQHKGGQIKGLKAISKNGIIKYVKENEIEKYKINGWIEGGISTTKNFVWMHKLNENNTYQNTSCNKCDVNIFLKNGWQLGKNIPIRIFKNDKEITINSYDFEDYKQKGWRKGKIKKKKLKYKDGSTGYRWINKEGQQKLVSSEIADVLIKDGWKYGKIL